MAGWLGLAVLIAACSVAFARDALRESGEDASSGLTYSRATMRILTMVLILLLALGVAASVIRVATTFT